MRNQSLYLSYPAIFVVPLALGLPAAKKAPVVILEEIAKPSTVWYLAMRVCIENPARCISTKVVRNWELEARRLSDHLPRNRPARLAMRSIAGGGRMSSEVRARQEWYHTIFQSPISKYPLTNFQYPTPNF
jgi:hypothetical protein